jgi:chemotaxis signal transduction protein
MESQWVTFKLADETFGFEIRSVKEMLRMPPIVALPHSAPDNLGVTLIRKEIIPVFDLRTRFGMNSARQSSDELIALLQAHLQDHENWLVELEKSVTEHREFTLTTDPHACKFGAWINAFNSDDATLMRIVKRFDAPHRQIHEVAAKVREWESDQNYDGALNLIKNICDTALVQLSRLFGEAMDQVRSQTHQSLIIIGSRTCTLGVAVDEIRSVLKCNDDDIQIPEEGSELNQFTGLIGLLPQKNSAKFVQLLDTALLYPQLEGAPAGSPIPL